MQTEVSGMASHFHVVLVRDVHLELLIVGFWCCILAHAGEAASRTTHGQVDDEVDLHSLGVHLPPPEYEDVDLQHSDVLVVDLLHGGVLDVDLLHGELVDVRLVDGVLDDVRLVVDSVLDDVRLLVDGVLDDVRTR